MGRKRTVDIAPTMKFSNLTALSFPYYRKEGKGKRLVCDFVCVCGKKKTIRAIHVFYGNTKSCNCLRWNRLGDGESAFNSLLWEYKYHAKARGLSFELAKEDFRVLTKQCCKYCGVGPKQEAIRNWRKSKSTPYLYNGIDRVDNAQGYTLENCVTCCKVCNIAKRALSLEQFMEWVARLVKFHNLKETVPNQSEENQ